jgi:GntR family transcriptional regulator
LLHARARVPRHELPCHRSLADRGAVTFHEGVVVFLYTVCIQSTTVPLRVDLNSSIPVYRQIVDGLRILLVNGELNPGDSMPPVRRLALDLGVHFNTVAEAYRTLAEEGWLEIGRRTGARVVERARPNRADPKSGEAFQRRLRELIAEQQSRGVTRGRIARELRRLADTLERT